MVRTQIQLDEATYKKIKRLAYEQNKSIAQVIREKLSEEFGRTNEKKKLSLADFPIIGKYRSGKKDISERHDDYLAEDFK